MSPYNLCDGTGLVCENHPNLAWGGASDGTFTCDCGAGMRCVGCISCSADEADRLYTAWLADSSAVNIDGDQLIRFQARLAKSLKQDADA